MFRYNVAAYSCFVSGVARGRVTRSPLENDTHRGRGRVLSTRRDTFSEPCSHSAITARQCESGCDVVGHEVKIGLFLRFGIRHCRWQRIAKVTGVGCGRAVVGRQGGVTCSIEIRTLKVSRPSLHMLGGMLEDSQTSLLVREMPQRTTTLYLYKYNSESQSCFDRWLCEYFRIRNHLRAGAKNRTSVVSFTSSTFIELCTCVREKRTKLVCTFGFWFQFHFIVRTQYLCV